MALHAPVKSNDFTPAPAGVQAAVCCDVVDLGLQQTNWGAKHQIWIVWLLSEIEPESGKPFLVTKRYTFSMHEKSNLFADVCSWLGLRMTPDQAERCDLEKMIGRPCLLNIMHNHKDGSTYANVNTVMPLPNGYPVPQIGDYKRHLYRDADENPRDVRNPKCQGHQPQSSVSDNGVSQPQANGYQQPQTAPAPAQMPPQQPHPNATAPAFQGHQQAPAQQAAADDFYNEDDLPF